MQYKNELKLAKSSFYKKELSQIRTAKPSNWYKNIKKITDYNQDKNNQLIIDEISHMSVKEQVEKIAEQFSSRSHIIQLKVYHSFIQVKFG